MSIDVEESETIDIKTGKETGHEVHFGAIILSTTILFTACSFLVTGVTMLGGCG